MVTRVLDTSVVVKWFIEEIGSAAAETYLEGLTSGKSRVVAPSVLFYEVASVFWSRRRDVMSHELALAAFEELSRLPLDVSDWSDLLPAALDLAFRASISPYDAAFVVLTEELGCDLITADRPLWTKMHANRPWVKLLDGI